MARLPTLKPRLQPATTSRVRMDTVAERRITGRKLQARRLRVWQRDPHCAECGRVVAYPHGFELDHKVPLFQGGADTDDNCQVLCVWHEDGQKRGCHQAKTAADLSREGAGKSLGG